MNTESANKFISALVKSLQTLCHGYVEFEDGIEIIGHLYLNIDSGSTFDYVVKEKVCKNAQNSTVFISKSFHAEGKPENTLITDDKGVITHGVEAAGMDDGTMSPSGTTRLQSAITNISNVLSGTQSQATSHSSSLQNTGKRKREHNGHYGSQLPYKYTTLQSSSSAMPYFSNSAKQQHSSRDGSKQFSNSQAEFFGGDSNASSGMGHDDEEDIDLDVTFVKEEYGDRNRGASAPARINQDTSANQQNLMHENNSGASYPLGYHHQQSQQFAGSGGGDVGTMNQAFHDPTQVDIGHHIPPPPNPRTPLAFKSRGSVVGRPSASPASSSSASKNSLTHTIRQNKWAISRAREWLSSQGMPTNFEQFTDVQLNQLLLGFYTSSQKKDGSPFSGTALIAFRTALNRHLNSCGRRVSLASHDVFKPSNIALSRMMLNSMKVNKSISTQDIVLLYSSGSLSNQNPYSLLHKVWFELQLQFRSKINWSIVRPGHFYFSHDNNGKTVVNWNTTSQGSSTEVSIVATGGPFCLIESLQLYMSKRNPSCPTFLQVPAPPDLTSQGIWYLGEELKDSKIKGIMKKLSELAKLSRTYTNSSVIHSFEDYYQALVDLGDEKDDGLQC